MLAAIPGVVVACFVLFAVGFLLAAVGHLFRVRAAVILGLGLVFLGVVLLPTLIRLSL